MLGSGSQYLVSNPIKALSIYSAGRPSVCDREQIFVSMDVLTKIMDEAGTIGRQDAAAIAPVLRLLASRNSSATYGLPSIEDALRIDWRGPHGTRSPFPKRTSDGTLAQARVVHFATHGLVASETESIAKSLAEPALLLTPPDVATATDDGLLTASEVTELRLDADWVVLSACNTAAGGEKGDAEALSGLARAFFYAGAHSLLVSHWSSIARRP